MSKGKLNFGKKDAGELPKLGVSETGKSREDLEALIEGYKKQNPVKAAQKKEEFERKLALLSPAKKEEPKEDEEQPEDDEVADEAPKKGKGKK